MICVLVDVVLLVVFLYAVMLFLGGMFGCV
jgi:hypothetical protein